MYIHINRQILYYEKTGAGCPILLLHGNGEDHTIFDELVPLLERDFTVYAIDSRGHGESNPTEEFHYEGMAEDIEEFITSLEIERPVIYGFSDGGITGLLVAIRRPELLSGLIISGANLEPGGMKWAVRQKIRRHYNKTHDPLELMMLREPDIDPDMLSRVQIPVLVLAGSDDIIRESHTKLIADSLPQSVLRILPGEDHGSYVIHSRKLYEYIRDFAVF